MNTIRSQSFEETALEYYNCAVDCELRSPQDNKKSFRRYLIAALLGSNDAALHVAMAYKGGIGIGRSDKLARFWSTRASNSFI